MSPSLSLSLSLTSHALCNSGFQITTYIFQNKKERCLQREYLSHLSASACPTPFHWKWNVLVTLTQLLNQRTKMAFDRAQGSFLSASDACKNNRVPRSSMVNTAVLAWGRQRADGGRSRAAGQGRTHQGSRFQA